MRTEAGFSIIEVMIAATIAMTVIAAISTMQTSMVTENRAISQKFTANEYAKTASQLLSDDSLCRCNTFQLQLHPYQPATTPPRYYADIPLATPLCSVCPASGLVADCPPDKILAIAGGTVGPAGSELPVSRLYVGDLQASNATGSEMKGSIQILLADSATASNKLLVRSLQPIRIARKFFVLGNRLNGCGASTSMFAVKEGAETFRSPTESSTPPFVECDAGQTAIGGGWQVTDPSTVPGCPDTPFGTIIASAPYGTRGWQVNLLCRRYKPFVTCYRPNGL